MSETRTFKCQQCGLIKELDTVFNYEVCPRCVGNLFPIDHAALIDWKERAEKAERRLQEAHMTVRGIIQSALAGYESAYKNEKGFIKWGQVARDIDEAFSIEEAPQ